MYHIARMMARFQLGRDEPAKFATLEQIERVERLLPLLLTRRMPQLDELAATSDSAHSLFYVWIPRLIENVGRLKEIREQQSASGRGAFGRETLAQLREEKAQLLDRNAALEADDICDQLGHSSPVITHKYSRQLYPGGINAAADVFERGLGGTCVVPRPPTGGTVVQLRPDQGNGFGDAPKASETGS